MQAQARRLSAKPPATSSARGVSWLAYLPEKSRLVFLVELADLSKALKVSGDWRQLDQFFFEWEETALTYADPELLADLTRPAGGDLGLAPCP